jgi:pimeloyl-ACP methyl ester carboxylesterase
MMNLSYTNIGLAPNTTFHYRIVAYNNGGTNYGLDSSFATAWVGVTITVPPQSQVANAGATVSFSVTATGTGQLSYQWLFNGANITGATSPTLTLNSVGAANSGAYSVVVWNAINSVVSAAAQLTVWQALTLVQTNRVATPAESAPPHPALPTQLNTFTSGAFGNTGTISSSKPTIVLTHGWIPSIGPWAFQGISGWPTDLAGALTLQGFGLTNNIVAWDWSNAASSFPCNPAQAAAQTPGQGGALGQALLTALGPGYKNHIHFIGHSFGTMVNAAAANYLHANGFWWTNTQMTLFDEAEIGSDVSSCADLFALALWSMPSASQTIYQPLPSNFDWADNYVSLVGQLHPQAANVILSYGLPTAEVSIAGLITDAASFHAYPCTWYSNTIPSPLSAAMGFRWSFEEGGLIAPPAPGTVYLQPATDDQYHQSVLVTTNWASATDLLTQRWQGYHISDRLTLGFAAVQLIDPAVGLVAGQMVSGEETSGVEAIINLVTQGGSGVSENVPHPLDGSPSTNTPACAWIPVTIPSNAVLMSFDFMLEGNGAQDSFAAALDGTNILSLAANLIQTNVDLNSGPIEVSQYAGQQVELFLGIVGGTSTNASLTASNFQFYAMPAPALQAQASGTNLVVSWPVWATGYALEASGTLEGTNAWTPLTNTPAIINFQNTITNAISGRSQFYRLQQQ